MTTGEKIRKVRGDLGITQKELALRLNVTPQLVSQYESGAKKPKMETIKKIAKALNVSFLILLSDADRQLFQDGFDLARYGTYMEYGGLLDAYDLLNEEGQQIAVERVEELTEIPKYQKENEAEPDDN